jgi:acyl carrier protein
MLIELDDVCRTVALVLGLRTAPPNGRIQEDLGAESFDVLNIVVTLEEKYGVSIDEAAAANVSTVRDLYHVLLKSRDGASRSRDPDRVA